MATERIGITRQSTVGVLYSNLPNEKLGKEHADFTADEKRASQHRDNSVFCNGRVYDFIYASDGKFCGSADSLLITTKYPVLMESLESVRDFTGKDTITLSLLNGVTSEGITEETFDRGVMLHSIAQLIDSVKAGNQVKYTKTGEIVIGTNNEGKRPQLRRVEAFSREDGIPHHVTEDTTYGQWSKLMLNCGINQICAIYDIPYRGYQNDQFYREEFWDTMEEVRRMAVLEGTPPKGADIERWPVVIDELDTDFMSSMRQDILAKRRTEVDLFSKTVMELAKKYGTEVPLNTKLYRKIKGLERNSR